MDIVYSAGNRLGAGIQLRRLLENTTGHNIKVAGYTKSSLLIDHIDWTLDALHNKFSEKKKDVLSEIFDHKNIPNVGIPEVEILINEVDEFAPDLIISDGEPILAHIAKSFGIKLWYCSPLHLLNGIKWERGQMRYYHFLDKAKKFLSRLPEADKTFIYSPFGDVSMRPVLKPGFERIRPYYYKMDESLYREGIAVIQDPDRISTLSRLLNCTSFDITLVSQFHYQLSHLYSRDISDLRVYKKLLSNCSWFLTTGETDYLSDAIYNSIDNICIAPNIDDTESLLNAAMCSYYRIGKNVGQVELMDKFALEEMEKSFGSSCKGRKILDKQPKQYLHEAIGNLCQNI